MYMCHEVSHWISPIVAVLDILQWRPKALDVRLSRLTVPIFTLAFLHPRRMYTLSLQDIHDAPKGLLRVYRSRVRNFGKMRCVRARVDDRQSRCVAGGRRIKIVRMLGVE